MWQLLKIYLKIIKFPGEGWHRPERKRATQFGSFYLRVGAIAFGIGNMVYSGLELGQYFELQSGENTGCNNVSQLYI